MDAVSLSFSSQVFELFSFSSQMTSRQPQSLPALPGADLAGQPPAPQDTTPAIAPEQAGSSSTVVRQSSQAAFLDLHVQIQLTEQEQARKQGHELRHAMRHLLKDLIHDLQGQLERLDEESSGLGQQAQDQIAGLAKDLKKALKQAFRGMFGDRHRAAGAPPLMGPGNLLSAVRSALDDLLSGLRDILGRESTPSARGDTTENAAASPALAGPGAAGGKAVAQPPAPAGAASGSEAEGAEAFPGAEEEAAESGQPADLLQALTDIFDNFMRRLEDLLAGNPLPAKSGDRPTYSASFNLTFAYFARTSFELSTSSSAQAVDTVA